MLPDCVRISADDTRSADALERHGWRFVEVLETWRRKMPWHTTRPQRVRLAKREDRDACMKIAGKAFAYDRLHADRQIPKEMADDAKREWVKASFENPAQVFVCDPGHILGFLIFQPKGQTVVIDLLAVDPQAQWNGVGTDLVRATLGLPDYRWIEAGTQAINEPARKLYHRLNFRVVKAQKSYHR